jgi:hypothetical protein
MPRWSAVGASRRSASTVGGEMVKARKQAERGVESQAAR